MDKEDQGFAFVVAHGPHAFVIASDGTVPGCCYAGMIVRSGAGYNAIPSRDLMMIGRVDFGKQRHHASIEDAEKWLGREAFKLARTMRHGVSNMGAAFAVAVAKPLIVGG